MGRATCTPGIRTVGAAKVRVYCGPAHAEVRARGRTYSIRNGSCVKKAGTLIVNIGIATLANPLSSAPPRTSSFGALIAASRDGTFHAGSSVGVSWTAPGHAYLFAAGSLHRRFQDIHAVTQQIQGRRAHYQSVGKFLLGLKAESRWW